MSRVDLGQRMYYDPDMYEYIMLDLTGKIPAIEPAEIDGKMLLPKSELHCSLVAAGRLAKDKNEQLKMVETTKRYLTQNKIGLGSISDERFICRKDGKMTIVVPLKILGVDDLFDAIRAFKSDFRNPFLHVTIAKSKETPFGIGLHSNDDFANYCEKLSID